MPYIGNIPTQESISDRKSYTGDGTRTVFGVLYTENMVEVYQNGIKLKENADYTTNASGSYITFVLAPESGDVVDVVGYNEITDLARSSYLRETFTATSGQTQFNLSANISGSDKINVFLNGIRLSEIDYTLDYTNNRVTFASGRAADDVVAVEINTPGWRSDNHNARNEKAYHPLFSTPDTINEDLYIPAGENGMMVGPVTLNGVLTVDGTFTVI